MKILFIGGTGTISSAISALLAAQGHELYLLNRGNRPDRLPQGARALQADIHDEAAAAAALQGRMSGTWWRTSSPSLPADVERDYRLFHGRTRQYVFISSASAYHKPVPDYRISESTSLANPYWEYSRQKIACEEYLMRQYRAGGFPSPSCARATLTANAPYRWAVHGDRGSWQVLSRMLQGKPVIIHGDGTSLWTMTHSRDFARAFVGLLGNPHAIGEAVQITSGETLTWNQIYAAIARALGGSCGPCTCRPSSWMPAGRMTSGARCWATRRTPWCSTTRSCTARAGLHRHHPLRPGRAGNGGLRAVPSRLPNARPGL